MVFPQPGGPHSIIDGISSASSKVLKRLLLPNTLDCPTYSAKVLGRILSASGINWLFFDFWALFFPDTGEFKLWQEPDSFVAEDTPLLIAVPLCSSDLKPFVASFDFRLLKGLFPFDFPAKFEELLEKLLFKALDGGLVINTVLAFVPGLFPKIPVDLSNKEAVAVGEVESYRILVAASSPVDEFEGPFVFRHLFTCSFTKEVGKERPQTGQSTRLVCDMIIHVNCA